MSQLWFVVVGSADARQSVPLQGVAVTGLIRDVVAEYTVTQTYVNPLPNATIEAAYTFPLYEGVAVVGFRAEVDGRTILGKVRERAAAREEYHEAVRAGKTASLLEQEKPDVFQACIGNIPPGKTISIRITLVSEIKHDAGEDQVRFVLPTTVAPRYGQNYNRGFFGDTRSRDFGFSTLNSPVSSNSKLSVDLACAMSSPITSVQSPSHTMEVHIGTTETINSSESLAYDPNCARVSLSADSLLDRDLVIIIQSLGLDQPRALVERHPTEQTHAISLTFQPRFALQPLRSTELVFLVDRSGSMSGAQIKQAGEALELFLRSIPFENHYFNVIGFGSTHSALFWRSVEYNEDTLQTGVNYAQTMQADMGGTEIASAFEAAFQRQRDDVPTQIFLLTDGQIWNVEQLARSISAAVDDGERRGSPLRVFSLGVGHSVSHHLVESVARAGGGYAQLVVAGERMEKKVLNMLRGGLTPPVTNAAVQWSDSIADDFVMVGDDGPALEDTKNAASKPLINLFSESPVVASESSTPPAPEIAVAIQQAPFKLPAPCRGARFTPYAILSPRTPLPKEVVLRGDSPDGPVELRVKVDSVVEGETMLHSLAARALVRDLEEGSSHIHALGKTLAARDEQMLKRLGVHVAQREGQKRSDFLPLSFNHVTELTKQKIVDLGVKYNLSTKHTSWVAVDEEGPRSAAGPYIVNAVAQSVPQFPSLQHRACPIPPPTTSLFGKSTATPFGSASPFGQAIAAVSLGAPQAFTTGEAFAQQAPSSSFNFGATKLGMSGTSTPAFGAMTSAASQARPTFGAIQDSPISATPAFGAPQPQAFGHGSFGSHGVPQRADAMETDDLGHQQVFRAGDEAATSSSEGRKLLRSILQHQSFDGLFTPAPAIGALFITSADKTHLGELRKRCIGAVELTEQQWEAVWTTCLVVEFIKAKLKDLKDEWELVVEKAERRLESLLKNSEDLARLKTAAKPFLKYAPSNIE